MVSYYQGSPDIHKFPITCASAAVNCVLSLLLILPQSPKWMLEMATRRRKANEERIAVMNVEIIIRIGQKGVS